MNYKSKKDPEVTAAFDFEDEKHHSTYLIYLSGPKKGTSFCVTNATLKRYWEPLEEVSNPLMFTQDEVSQINTPYKPDVTPRYIPKPQSVIEYEEKKHRTKHNNELPEFDSLVEMFGFMLKKVNEKSSYMLFKDGTSLHRKSQNIRLYTVENIWMALTEKGFESKPNNDKDRPFAFIINTKQEFDDMCEVLINILNTKKEEN